MKVCISLTKGCYFGKEINENVCFKGEWCCDSCIKEGNHSCALCPNEGGALKMYLVNNGRLFQWRHVVCHFWTIAFDNSFYNVSNNSLSDSKFCYLCSDPEKSVIGSFLRCFLCNSSFHVTCALSSLNVCVSAEGLSLESIICGNCDLKTCNNKIQYIHSDKIDSKKTDGTSNFDFKHLAEFQCIFIQEYQKYKNNREIEMIKLKNENQILENQRDFLINSILMLKSKFFSATSDVTTFAFKQKQVDSKIAQIRTCLLEIHDFALKNGWDFKVLDDYSQDVVSRQTRKKKKTPINSDNVINFFLNLNQENNELFLPHISHIEDFNNGKISPSEILTAPFLPNLSSLTSQDFPEYPKAGPKSTSAFTCSVCKTRLLPSTAPCLKEYRDYLLTCCKCRVKAHLCCADPMLSGPSSKWFCDKCYSTTSRNSNYSKNESIVVGISSEFRRTRTSSLLSVTSNGSHNGKKKHIFE